MPIYEAVCTRCQTRHEYWASVENREATPVCCGWPSSKILSATRGTVDITPYMTVAHDKETKKPVWIKSRKDHREFVRRNGFEEVGNESTMPKDALARIEEKRYVAHELDDSVNALP